MKLTSYNERYVKWRIFKSGKLNKINELRLRKIDAIYYLLQHLMSIAILTAQYPPLSN